MSGIEDSNVQLDDASAYWRASYATTRILTESANLPTATRAILHLLLSFRIWRAAVFWLVDELSVMLRCSEFVQSPGVDLTRFEKVSRSRTFAIGQGLPGRVWADKRAIWIETLGRTDNFPRLSVAQLDGIGGACAFAVRSGRFVYGVIELFSCAPVERSEQFSTFIDALGAQIGVFFERNNAHASTDVADAQFRLIAEGASIAVFTIDEDSVVQFANSAVETVFGYDPGEVIGKSLTMVMPEYLRHVHDHGLRRYVQTGVRHVNWNRVPLPGLHRDGHEIPLEISFGEFWRGGKRVFTGFCRVRNKLRKTSPTKTSSLPKDR